MIIRQLDHYLEPLQVSSRLAGQPDFVFLDSSDQQNGYANYSIIAIEPFLKFSFQKGESFLSHLAQGQEDIPGQEYCRSAFSPGWGDQFRGRRGDPFDLLRKLLNRFQLPPGYSPSNDFPLPVGAAIGYISYDLGAYLEAGICPLNGFGDWHGFEDWPDMEWRFYDTLLVFDQARRIMTLVSTGLPFSGEERNRWANYRLSRFISRLEKIQAAGRNVVPSPICSHSAKNADSLKDIDFLKSIRSNFSVDSYQRTVQTIKAYIAQGDVYQVNLSQQFCAGTKEAGFDLYRKIRRVNRVPYGGYLRFDQREILCFSMERFLRMDGRRVQTRPIKGTTPRGQTPQEDLIRARQLWNSEKDRAELLMVVDMERNDLGRVCANHSVRVDNLFEVEKYATVFHLVSTVSGHLRPEFDHIDCLRACFPGGSITGTPKIRAMEIIAELEKIRRGVYCGALGYFGFNQISDFNIPIRTILKQGPRLRFNAGGGVVADSDPYLEYLETLHKVRSFLACLQSS